MILQQYRLDNHAEGYTWATWDVDDNTTRAYSIASWAEYGITDNKEDFIRLLDILDAYGENLETLADAVNNGGGVAGFVGDFDSYRDAAQTIINSAYVTTKACELLANAVENADYEGSTVLEELGLAAPIITPNAFVVRFEC